MKQTIRDTSYVFNENERARIGNLLGILSFRKIAYRVLNKNGKVIITVPENAEDYLL